MSVKYQDILNEINDLRIDSSDAVFDTTTTGVRMINRAIDFLQRKHDWEFTVVPQRISYYRGVCLYELNSSYKELQNVREIGSKRIRFNRVVHQDFATTRMNNPVATMRRNGKQYLAIDAPGQDLVVDSLSSLASDGTWSNITGTTGLRDNTADSVNGLGSIEFTMDSAIVGAIENATHSAVDLTYYYKNGARYMWVYIDDVTNLSSFTLRIASGVSDYIEETVTTDFIGESFKNGWNKVLFTSWSDTGSYDVTSNTIFRFTATFSSASSTRIMINELKVGERIDLEATYYTHNFVRQNSDGALQNRFTGLDNNDEPLYSGSYDWMKSVHVDIAMYDVFGIQEEGATAINNSKIERDRAVSDAIRRLPSNVMIAYSFETPYQYVSSIGQRINVSSSDELIYYIS